VLLWLAAVWFLPIVAHPVWILGLGGLFAVIAGPAFGGSDVMGGCEEYAFSQPATRTERFDARLLVALFCLIAFTGMSAFALANHLADLVLSFFVSTGLALVDLRRPELLYGALFAVPLAALAIGFSVAALATTRAVAYTAWVWAALGALTGLRAGLSLEDYFWDRLSGRITVPLLAAVAVITLAIARRLYAEKEAGRASSPLRLPLSGWAALGAAALAALGVALLITWFIANFARAL
jgi:predicted DNA-binding ribbon-helix-helix protein